MIRNEKQYKISRKRLADITAKLERLLPGEGEKELQNEMMRASLKNFKEDIEKEIEEYDALKNGKQPRLKERSISELPNLIIEYKIANNLTHKEFSKTLGLKEEQLQRYESEGFKSVSFQNLIKFINIIDLDLKIKAPTLKRRKAKKSTLQP